MADEGNGSDSGVSTELTVVPDGPGRLSVVDPDAVFKEGRLDFTAIDKIQGVTFDDIVPFGQRIATNARNANWWYGDFLRWASKRFGPEYAQLLDPRGLSQEYYTQVVHVAEVFPKEDRLIPTDDPENPCPGVSWSHHREAARVPSRRKRIALLKEAMDRNWSTRDLSLQVKKLLAVDVEENPPPAPSTHSETVTITVGARDAAKLQERMASFREELKAQLAAEGLDVRGVSTKESGASVESETPPEEKAPAKEAAAKKAAVKTGTTPAAAAKKKTVKKAAAAKKPAAASKG